MFVDRSVARVVSGLRLNDTPHGISPRREANVNTLKIMDIIPGVRLHPGVKVVAKNDAKDIRDMVNKLPKA